MIESLTRFSLAIRSLNTSDSFFPRMELTKPSKNSSQKKLKFQSNLDKNKNKNGKNVILVYEFIKTYRFVYEYNQNSLPSTKKFPNNRFGLNKNKRTWWIVL